MSYFQGGKVSSYGSMKLYFVASNKNCLEEAILVDATMYSLIVNSSEEMFEIYTNFPLQTRDMVCHERQN